MIPRPVMLAILFSTIMAYGLPAAAQESTGVETRVVVESEGWELIGDLLLPAADEPLPAVLMLNKAAGNRTIYQELARQLAVRGIGSLRLDLPGHGESTNLGRFMPGELERDPLIWDSEVQVIAATNYLRQHPDVDPNRLGIIGASYSGEEMAEAGRLDGYVSAYVELSPGSLTQESIDGMDASGVAWLFIVSRDERHLREIQADVQARSESAEVLILPGAEHATRLLVEHPGLAERIAVWLDRKLK